MLQRGESLQGLDLEDFLHPQILSALQPVHKKSTGNEIIQGYSWLSNFLAVRGGDEKDTDFWRPSATNLELSQSPSMQLNPNTNEEGL